MEPEPAFGLLAYPVFQTVIHGLRERRYRYSVLAVRERQRLLARDPEARGSKPFDPHPLFASFITAALQQSRLV